MMKDIFLNFAHICENAFLSEDKKLNIIGDFDRINFNRPEEEKGKQIALPFYIVFNFSGPKGEYETAIKITGENEEVILPARVIKQNLQGEKVGFIGKYNVLFPKPGKYFIEIYVNENLLKTMPLELNEESMQRSA